MAAILYVIIMISQAIDILAAYYSGELDNDLVEWIAAIIGMILWPIVTPAYAIIKLVCAIQSKKDSEKSNEES